MDRGNSFDIIQAIVKDFIFAVQNAIFEFLAMLPSWPQEKLSKDVSRQMLVNSNCLVLFWRSKTAPNSGNHYLNTLNFAVFLILLSIER